MNAKLPLLTTIALLPFAALAEEPAAAPAGYALKNRSSFSAPEDARAPFWPIGWSKKVTQTAPTSATAPIAAKVAIDPANYKITSILLGSPSLAVINGRAYEEGEYLKTPRAKDGAPAPVAQSAQPRICVQRITDSAVVLQQGAEQVTVPFARAGLAAKGPVRDLLSEDR
jgi:hypothetical protein